MRPPALRVTFEAEGDEGLIVDLFAGGGGASSAVAEALGRDPDIAINHSRAAITMYRANHPKTRTFIENVWKVKPSEACEGRRVYVLWASPDCTHHANAKGSKPLSTKRRSLAYSVVRWAREVQPQFIFVENVREFEGWGPLDNQGRPDKAKAGRSFKAWVRKICSFGYVAEWKLLTAADFGAPTTRTRLFMVFRRDGRPVVWPTPSHGAGRPQPWRSAAEVIDWNDLGRSIFDRAKPLADATLRRVVVGIEREVAGGEPFLVKYYGTGTPAAVADPLDTITTRDRFALVTPFLVKYHGGSKAHQAERTHALREPLRTLDTSNRFALVAPVIVRHNGGENGHQPAPRKVGAPLGAVTTRNQDSLVTAHLMRAGYLVKLYGTSTTADVRKPLPTVTTGGGKGGGHLAAVQALLRKFGTAPKAQRDLFSPLEPGMVVIDGEVWVIVDIFFRMLRPHELFKANGFRADYIIAPDLDGKPMSLGKQTELVGNSVSPPPACALITSNVREAA